MADSRVDILLNLRSQLTGAGETLSGINSISRATSAASAEWGQFQKVISRRLSLTDVGKSVLGGLGIGSGFAIASKIAEQIAAYWERAAEAAKRVESSTDRSAKAIEARLALGRTDEQQLAVAQQRRFDLESEMAKLSGEELAAATARRDENDLLIAQLEASIKKARAAEMERLTSINAEAQQRRASLGEQLKNAEAWAGITGNNLRVAKEFGAVAIDQKQATFQIVKATAEHEQALERVAKLKAQITDQTDRQLQAEMGIAQNAIAGIEGNNALTKREQIAQILPLLERENSLLTQRIALLAEAAARTDDPKEKNQLLDRIDRLQTELAHVTKQRTDYANPETLALRDTKSLREMGIGTNADGTPAQVDPTKHYDGVGAGLRGGLAQEIAAAGTAGDQVANGIRSTLGSAVASISQGITGWINGTTTWKQALSNIGMTIFNTMLQTIIQMGVQWLINAALIKTGMLGIEATGDALRTARVAKENAAEGATLPMKTAGAAASGISSFGVALAFGALAVALIMGLAGGFARGGYTSDGPRDQPAGIVHAGEWVAPQWLVRDETYGPMVAMLEAARTGAPGFEFGGSTGPKWATKLATTGIDQNVVNWWRSMSGGSQLQGTGNEHAAAESARLSLGADLVGALGGLPASTFGGTTEPVAGVGVSGGVGSDAVASMRSLLEAVRDRFVTVNVNNEIEATRIARHSAAAGDVVRIVQEKFGIYPSQG